ncbi:MAG: hypothetical protein ACKPEY_20110 [Planctomycetota bacterium]
MQPRLDRRNRRPLITRSPVDSPEPLLDFFDSPAAVTTPFEWYFLVDETADCPMVFSFVMEISGAIDLPRWQSALDEALPRHPLLNACLDSTAGRQPGRWRRCLQPERVQIFARPEELPANWQSFDLSQERGFKLAIIQSGAKGAVAASEPTASAADSHSEDRSARDQRWLFVLTFHHAVTDGLGARAFVADLNYAYGKRTSRGEVEAVTQRTRRRRQSSSEQQIQAALINRGNFERPTNRALSLRQKLRLIAKECWSILTRRSAALGGSLAVSESSQPAPLNDADSAEWSLSSFSARSLPASLEMQGLRFSHQQTQRCKQAATSANVTLNEYLLAVFCKSVTHFLTTPQGRIPSWISVVTPVHLSRELLRSGQACNAISYAFLHSRGSESLNLTAQMQRFSEIFTRLRQTRSPLIFLDTLARLRRLPEAISRRFIRGSNAATFVFSYVGESSHRIADDVAFAADAPAESRHVNLGDCQIHGLWGAPPVRRGTELAVTVNLFTDQLLISFRHAERFFPAEQVRNLQQLILLELRESLSTISPSC